MNFYVMPDAHTHAHFLNSKQKNIRIRKLSQFLFFLSYKKIWGLGVGGGGGVGGGAEFKSESKFELLVRQSKEPRFKK
jgi:hypothetical protein